MYRQGKYTQKKGLVNSTKLALKRRWKWWKGLSKKKKALLIAAPILGFLIITPIATYMYYYNDIGNVERLLNRNNTGVVLMDKNRKVFFSSGKAEHRELLPLSKISDSTEKALVAAEDKDFYNHSGFSPLGIMRAMYSNLVAQDITGGGSTITQQLAKNTLLTEQQTVLRKYQELTIAMAIEQRYTKDEILSMYLNSVFYGGTVFGITDAAKTYFNKSPAKLTLAESTMLIGLLPAPNAYSPIFGDPELAKERQGYVLSRMVTEGYITEAEKEAASAVKLTYAEQSSIDSEAPHFAEMVLDQLYDEYGEEKVQRSGFQVKTTLDLRLQKIANESVANGMPNVDANGGSNASLLAIDPKSGGILSLVGSRDYDNKQFGNVNMATTARQPGSTFKPIYYSQALADGVITPVTVLDDSKKDFGGYTPMNYDLSFRGNVTARQALNWSLNIPAVEVMQKYGINRSIEGAKDLGITTLDEKKNYGLSLAIGSAEIPLTQMTNAYAAFANGGTQYEQRSIDSIQDKYDNTVFVTDKESHRAISEQGAYLISNILADNQTRSRMFGSSLNVTGTDFRTKTVAVKTGTTDDFRDAWTIGYTPDIAVGVWAGNNDNTVMTNGGGGVAGPIWREMMGRAIGTANPHFTQPSGIKKATVCTDMGTMTDVFLSAKVPKECEKKKDDKPKDDDKPKEDEDDEACTVAGKENLSADNPNCVEELCEIEGKEDLAANDPNCVEDVDTDGDGVTDDEDSCPGTLPNTEIDETGCPVAPPPGNSSGGGNGNGRRSP